MKKTLLAFVCSLLLLSAVFTSTGYAMFETPASYGTLPINSNVGLLYGPPLPANIPALLARSSAAEALQKIEQAIPETLPYKVKQGDSLYSISAAFNTTVEALVQLNNLPNANLLRIDQELQIPNLERKQLDPDLTIKNILSADLTAYTAGYESTGKHPGDPGYGITASGKRVQEQQTIAVDPAIIPLGTKVYIEGIGVRVAEDTGGAIVGNRIDVFMNDLTAALQFGYKKNIKVYVLDNKPSPA